MRKWQLAVAGATTLLVAAACADRTVTDPGLRALRPHGSSKTSVTGAGFTTVDENKDGTGHCLNGNPNTNCNIYDGKEYVWLNGGPSAAYVGDGTYFFAVLAPGGQHDPNDGAADLLSTDAYTDRTFSVSAGTVTYSGPHDVDGNKIQLMPYADTPNPGGVYIMAICALGDGQPVTPSDCKYDAFKINAGTTIIQAATLTVEKGATPTASTSYTWNIAKSVDKTHVDLYGSGSAKFTYTVSVTHSAGSTTYGVTGTITVHNTNSVSVDGVSISDALDDGTTCSIKDSGNNSVTGPVTIVAGDNTFSYTCAPTGSTATKNHVAISWSEQFLDDGSHLSAGGDQFDKLFTYPTPTIVDGSVTVTDNYNGTVTTLGTVSYTDASPKTFTYSHTVNFNPNFGCTEYDNTATFTTNTTGTTGNSSQAVTVCSFGAAYTIGYWGNHMSISTDKDCKGLPSGTSCSNNGPWTKTYLPKILGTYTVSTIAQAAAVIVANNCSSTTDQNAVGCLAAQLLAAKLNRSIAGANTCIDATITAADNFLISVSYIGPTGKYTLTAAQRTSAVSLKTALDNYNNAKGC